MSLSLMWKRSGKTCIGVKSLTAGGLHLVKDAVEAAKNKQNMMFDNGTGAIFALKARG